MFYSEVTLVVTSAVDNFPKHFIYFFFFFPRKLGITGNLSGSSLISLEKIKKIKTMFATILNAILTIKVPSKIVADEILIIVIIIIIIIIIFQRN